MVFGRHKKPPLLERIRSFVWPRRGFSRAWKYVAARLSRIKATPHAIAAGFASGAAASFTPLLGLHFLLSFVIAFFTRGSMIAAAIGTVVGNPLTFPLIFAATYWTGARILWLVTPAPEAVATGVPGEEFDEVAPERAADALLEAAETMLDDGSLIDNVIALWPILSTMLVGAVPLAIAAFGFFYVVVRFAVAAIHRRRAARRARRDVGA